MFCKFLALFAISWVAIVLYKCTPLRWTSTERVLCETMYNLGTVLLVFNPLASLDGTLPQCRESALPVENPPPVLYLGQGEPVEVAINTLRHAAKNRDTIVIWKNFTRGMLDAYMDKEYVRQHFNNDSYFFATNFSNYKFQEVGLQDALNEMDKLYLGFSYTLLERNPRIWQDVNTMLSSYGRDLQEIIPVNFSKHHAFLYEGKKYRTGLHQAPISDWFMQLSNTKRWRFMQPKYTPYARIVTHDGISLNSAWDFFPEDTRVPIVDVLTEPGDLMYFPAHWWHEVHNEGDEFGFAFGFRPFDDMVNLPLEILFPMRLHKGEMGHRLLVAASLIKGGISKLMKSTQVTTANSNSGLASRRVGICAMMKEIRKFVPTWSWDKMAPPGTTSDCPYELEGANSIQEDSVRVPSVTGAKEL